jgi:radical SAM superfamily enzyme YgiQ (UPF0313 family)
VKEIKLTTINAKWIHPSLALRLLKANLGSLEERCEIIELNLRQPLAEKIEALAAARPLILGISVSIWNHLATLELLEELGKTWAEKGAKPIVVLGGPEVTHLPESSEIFRFADYVIRGEGETAFRLLCENIFEAKRPSQEQKIPPKFINAENVNLGEIKNAYHLYTDEDIAKKLIYVEASRGCPFNCEFCLSAVKPKTEEQGGVVREFPLEPFLAEMDALVKGANKTHSVSCVDEQMLHGVAPVKSSLNNKGSEPLGERACGAKTFKFLDRTFNINIKRALRIIEFFLEKLERQKARLVVHFEMVPSIFPPELREALTRFPPETLRLEIGIQTLNAETAALIGRFSEPEKELETICFLREKTNAVVHADLIAGLPGEDLASFGRGFDRLWQAMESAKFDSARAGRPRAEIQPGILKLLPGAPISRHSKAFGMRYNPLPPYEIEETASISAPELLRIRNFARFWELIINRGLADFAEKGPVFNKFMALSDMLYSHFGRNWGIDRGELLEFLEKKAEMTKFNKN